MNPHRAHLLTHQLCRISSVLKAEFGLSRTRIAHLLEFGAIYADGRRMREDRELGPGVAVRVHFRPKRFLVPESIPVVMEDPDFVCIDKPAGLPTHPTLDNYLENAWFAAQKQMNRKLFVTHRIDIGTQGLLMLATSGEAQARINRLFEERRITKIYRALTEAPPPLGRFEHYMNVDVRPPKPIDDGPRDGFVPAVLTVQRVWQVCEGLFASEIELETGRTHQVRAQLAFLGCPIIGDSMYGSDKKLVHERLALECFHVSFTHRSRTIGISRPTSITSPQNATDFQKSPPFTKHDSEFEKEQMQDRVQLGGGRLVTKK